MANHPNRSPIKIYGTTAHYTINSRTLGAMEFAVARDGGYIRCNGEQCCVGGSFRGETLRASEQTIVPTAKNWLRARYLKMANG